jgi:hypothetical protein
MAARRPKTKHSAQQASQDLTLKPKKLARLGVTRDDRPVWRLSLLDMEGPWGWKLASGKALDAIATFLKEMERLSWREIRSQMTGGLRRGPKHKYIPIASLDSRAQKRLVSLELDDYDGSWFRFRLGNVLRLWGIVDDGVFYPVWWDTDHSVCPSEKD